MSHKFDDLETTKQGVVKEQLLHYSMIDPSSKQVTISKLIIKDVAVNNDVTLCLCASKQNKRPKHNARGCSGI
jgi:hypothetical protein